MEVMLGLVIETPETKSIKIEQKFFKVLVALQIIKKVKLV